MVVEVLLGNALLYYPTAAVKRMMQIASDVKPKLYASFKVIAFHIKIIIFIVNNYLG